MIGSTVGTTSLTGSVTNSPAGAWLMGVTAMVGGGGAGGVGMTSVGGPSSKLQPVANNATTITFTRNGNRILEARLSKTRLPIALKYLKITLSSRPFFQLFLNAPSV
jgi:hypothetical protein